MERVESQHALPAVHLQVSGSVGRAGGITGDGISWSIHAETERDDGARCRVMVSGERVADITVHAPDGDLSEEAQQVCAALVWSAIRCVRGKVAR